MNEEIINTLELGSFNYTPVVAIINLAAACILGLVISYVYRQTHKGLSYSQSFVLFFLHCS